MIIKVNINSNLIEFEVKDNIENKLENLKDQVEKYTRVNKLFFDFKFQNVFLLEQNTEIELEWKYKFFSEKLILLTFNKKEYSLSENLLLESKVIDIMVSGIEDGSTFDDDKLEFNNPRIDNESCLINWIILSSEINLFLNSNNLQIDNLNIPKPLPNVKLSKYIGENAYKHLEKLTFEEIELFTIFCDYLDISYLLQVMCAFIAEKYVKNKSIDELKQIFDNF